MPDLILPSKLVPERIEVVFDFKDVLEWQETIAETLVTVTVHSGLDNSPQLVLYKQAIPLVTEVKQQLQEGLPGVIYKIECAATGTTGQIYVKYAYLAVLPNVSQRPPIIATFLTSQIYPIQDIESLGSAGAILSGTLWTRPVDGIESVGAIVTGTLEQILLTYSGPPEGINSVGGVVAGDLFSQLKSYTIRPEGIDSTALVVTGALELGLIIYDNYKPEGINSSATVISGTLT